MRRSIFPCFLGSIFCKLLFHMFPESIKNETRKLFHYYLYTEPDLLRTGVKWLIGVSNIMQIEDHVRENKHVIYNCTSYMYMCMINNCIFRRERNILSGKGTDIRPLLFRCNLQHGILHVIGVWSLPCAICMLLLHYSI